MKRLKWKRPLLAGGVACWFVMGGPIGATASDLTALDALTGRWLAVRTQLAEERRSWQEQEAHAKREIALLEAEQQRRTAELAESRTFMSDVEQERASVLGRKDQIDAEFERLEGLVLSSEAALRAWEDRIPAGLRQQVAAGFAALPRNAASARRTGLSRRLQTVVGLYTQIEALQNGVHVSQEILEPQGVRREVSVLYIGLARGFAVSRGGDWAALGFPGAQGWEWTPAPEAAGEIRLAISIVNREEVAQLVDLPMQVQRKNREEP